MSQLHIDLAAVLRQQGDLAAAANCYRQAIALAPEAETYHRLGLTLFEQEQWAAAVACYQRAIEVGKSRGSGIGWAMMYSNLGVR
ncbi:MAG: tetratricopeptide repeat protein [Leptolyngbyaceae cyanobacterium SM1_3_5]|nr:tetratricopeptide repeat protein [Leptolyngbyaceae cyanobacterium SM1_3_5]